MIHHARELDYVELLVPVDEWSAGTRGTVVWEDPETALVEVSPEFYGMDAEGFPTRDLMEVLVDVPYDDLKIVDPYVPSGR
jgi:hypothetical protein